MSECENPTMVDGAEQMCAGCVPCLRYISDYWCEVASEMEVEVERMREALRAVGCIYTGEAPDGEPCDCAVCEALAPSDDDEGGRFCDHCGGPTSCPGASWNRRKEESDGE